MRKVLTLFLALGLALPLSACGSFHLRGPASPTEAETAAPLELSGLLNAPVDVPGEEASASDPVPEAAGAAQPTDGLEGSYYNDFLRQTLVLDGAGGCSMGGAAGGYRAEDGTLTLRFGSREEKATVDGDGDITVEGRTGYFLRDWSFWHITPAEAGTASEAPALRSGSEDNGDGTLRFRDFENAVAFTYPAGMTLRREIIGGAAVSDGQGGAVTGRNVTELYATHSGSDDEFLTDYIKTFVFADFNMLYGALSGYERLTLLHEGIEGRLAAATLLLNGAEDGQSYRAGTILYTSTFADGTVNYICKTVIAPEGAEDSLESTVTDMSAVRLVEG